MCSLGHQPDSLLSLLVSEGFWTCHPWKFRADSLKKIIFHVSFEELSREEREGHSVRGKRRYRSMKNWWVQACVGSFMSWCSSPSPGQCRDPVMTSALDEVQVSKKNSNIRTLGHVLSQHLGSAPSCYLWNLWLWRTEKQPLRGVEQTGNSQDSEKSKGSCQRCP